MNQSLPLLLTFGLLSCGRSPGVSGTDTASKTPPNVVLISLDTLRADHVSAYGYERETTPNLDALAKRGLLFERCYSAAPWTLSSHMTIMTGLYVDQHRVAAPQKALSPEIPLLAERLSGAGYQSHALHSPGWIHEVHGFDRGFDIFGSHLNARLATQHLNELMPLRDGDPWFLFLHVFDIHSAPIQDDSRLLYRPPKAYRDVFRAGSEAYFKEGDARRLWNGLDEPTEEDLAALIALYDAGILYTDQRLGEWIELFEAEGVLENGVLVVTSDHGESLGQHGRVPDHGRLFEEGLHVPLVLFRSDAPGGGRRIERPVHHVDLVPTLLELCGLEIPDYLPGRSLFEEEVEPRTFSAVFRRDIARIRYPLKFVNPQHELRSDSLLDLSRDPEELRPIYKDDADFARLSEELERSFEAQMEGLGVPGNGPIKAKARTGPEQLERLRMLGYADALDDPSGEGAPEPGAPNTEFPNTGTPNTDRAGPAGGPGGKF